MQDETKKKKQYKSQADRCLPCIRRKPCSFSVGQFLRFGPFSFQIIFLVPQKGYLEANCNCFCCLYCCCCYSGRSSGSGSQPWQVGHIDERDGDEPVSFGIGDSVEVASWHLEGRPESHVRSLAPRRVAVAHRHEGGAAHDEEDKVASMRVLHYASQRPPAIKRGPTQHPTRH